MCFCAAAGAAAGAAVVHIHMRGAAATKESLVYQRLRSLIICH